MYQFFFLPQIFFPFPKFSSAGCISVRESLSFQNNYFGEEAKIIIKLLQTQKKMIWLNAKSSRQTKVVWFNAMFFVTQRNFFFSTLALFEWLNWWRKNVLSCRQDSRFRRLPFFCQSCIQCWKKRIEGKSCFCVLCNRAISPSLIINPRLTFCQEKIVDNTYEENNHLD